MTSYSQGAQVEREFKKILEKKGQVVTRAAGSGEYNSGMFYDLHSTDKTGKSFLWEIKSTSSKTKYFSNPELLRIGYLNRSAIAHKIKAFVVIKFKGSEPKFMTVTPEFVLRRCKVGKNERG